MRRQIALLSTFLLSTLFLGAGHTVAQSPSLVFNHVTVIDMTGAPPKSDMAVVVVGDRIAALGKAGAVRVPKGAQVVDATGKYLIPGLWDMHAHVFHYRLPEPPDAYDFPLFIANGVTSIREMWTKADRMDQVRLWRQQFYERPGTIPRFAAVGTLVDGPAGIWPNSDRVSTADEARRLVGTLKAGGVDFVKVYNELSREAYFAIADEATKRKIPFAGHVPTAITWREASEAGQQSIEHLAGIAGIFTDCAFMERMAKTALPNAIATNSPARPFMEEALELCDDQKALAFFQGLAKRGTSEVPTLIIYETAATDSETLYRDERLKYMPGGKDHFSRRPSRTAEESAAARRIQQRTLEMVSIMHRAGMNVMAGTDVSNPYLYPGFSLHDELALLVKAGFTPMEALQAATRNPATFLGMLGSLGTIERGKFADFVLLTASPLEDIRNTQRINAVVVNGRYLPKETLQKMLAEAEADARTKIEPR